MYMLPEPEADMELRAEPDRKLRLTGKRKKAPAHVAEESNECVLIAGPHWISFPYPVACRCEACAGRTTVGGPRAGF